MGNFRLHPGLLLLATALDAISPIACGAPGSGAGEAIEGDPSGGPVGGARQSPRESSSSATTATTGGTAQSADAGGSQGGTTNTSASGLAPPNGGMVGVHSSRPRDFVRRVGMHFDEGGTRHLFVGANYWQAMNLAADLPSGDRERLARELDRLRALGVTNLRLMAASEGPESEPFRMVPALMPSPGMYNEALFRGLDLVLDALAARGMRAVMCLNNYWQWSGGMGQYVSWAENTAIPYPIDGTGYDAYESYVARFYACATCQKLFFDHIRNVVTRKNTITGVVYRDDPTIFSWELANEPRRYPSNWIADTATYIKSLDSNHMVTTGSEGSNSGMDFESSHQADSIDYGTAHVWAENVGVYRADDASEANFDAAASYLTDYLAEHERKMRQLNKPLVLEEFGLARDGWLAGGKLAPESPTINRDRYYGLAFALVEASILRNESLAGDNFWAWAGEARPDGTWTGDPPHEPPGWYSIYDKDQRTLELIRAHSQNIARYGD